MRWQFAEFLLKGIYVGLILFLGLTLRNDDGYSGVAHVAVGTLGTLAVFIGVTAIRKIREGYRLRGRIGPFVLFLLLDNPGMVYAGVIMGMLLGVYSLLSGQNMFGPALESNDETIRYRLLYFVLGGAALGVAFNVLYQVEKLQVRFWLGLALAAGLVGGGIYALPNLTTASGQVLFASVLLLGIPLFYLLTLASMTEESEVEIAAVCAALGVSLWILTGAWFPGNENVQYTSLLIPAAIYYIYTRRILPGLRVFKHVLRGLGYANAGQIRPALLSLGRAMQLNPRNELAREQLWNVHRLMNFSEVVREPATLALLNFELCLIRASTLLLQGKPSPENLQEALRLVDLVANQRPAMRPRCDYWRAVAFTHQRHFDEAAAALLAVITGSDAEPDNPHRDAILFSAWQLAILLHPEMTRRVGTPQLSIPGRRMEAISAVEKRLAVSSEDAAAWDLKRVLYNELTEIEYSTRVVDSKPPEFFDHSYVQQLGMALVSDPTRWMRGCEYLHMAAVGIPQHGPSIYLTVAKAHEAAGEFPAVWQCYEAVKRIGRAVGPKELSAEERHTYFAVIKALGEDAAQRGDIASAIENYRLFCDYERAGINTYRTLAELYERQGDVWSALHATEQGLVYDSKDPTLAALKDRFYYSVKPEDLQTRVDQVKKWFDIGYCTQKARWLLERQGEDVDLLDWAAHLAELAQVVEPASMVVRVLRARMLRRRGEVDKAIALLEEVRGNKPEKFSSNEEEEAWYVSCRLLGDLYLNVKPDQAVLCFQEYRKHAKSGADTVYKMAVAYEHLGDQVRARKCYETVAAYESHPLAPEATSALHRLQAG